MLRTKKLHLEGTVKFGYRPAASPFGCFLSPTVDGSIEVPARTSRTSLSASIDASDWPTFQPTCARASASRRLVPPPAAERRVAIRPRAARRLVAGLAQDQRPRARLAVGAVLHERHARGLRAPEKKGGSRLHGISAAAASPSSPRTIRVAAAAASRFVSAD